MPPKPVALEKTLAKVARAEGLDQERLRRWVSFLAICGVLERAVAERVIDSYHLKGGVAMELRFAEKARATKDLDVGLPGTSDERLTLFREAISLGFDDFTFEVRGKPHTMERADTVRLELSVRYRTRGWQTIDVDLGPAIGQEFDLVEPTIPGLAAMGLRTPTPVRCIGIAEQVAQKLHACTGPGAAGRARDILDILLLDLLEALDLRSVKASAQRVFAERGTHAFPPEVQLDPAWGPELTALAGELGYTTEVAEEIESRFRALVRKLA